MRPLCHNHRLALAARAKDSGRRAVAPLSKKNKKNNNLCAQRIGTSPEYIQTGF